jgi:pilus assembly protein FimV
VTDLESQLNDLQRLLELKNDQLAQLQAAVTTTDEMAAETPAGDAVETEATDEAEPAAEAVDETQTPQAEVTDAVEPEADLVSEETAAADEEAMDAKPVEVEATTEQAAEETAPVAEEAQPAEKLEPPKPVILPTPKAEPSLYDRVMGDTTLLGGIIGGIVVFLALIWVWISRRRNSADFQESILVSTIDDDDDQIGSPEVTSQTTEETSFLSDFSPSDIDALQDETGEVDPLAEADVYIAYGRYQQAEELVRQAIDKDPERLELKHKLAEILFATKDKDAYLTLAEELKSAGTESKDSALWGKIVSMGTQLAPGAALFAGAVSASDDLGLDDFASMDDALDADLSDEFNLDDFDANSSVSDETVQANRSDLDFDMDLGLDELNKGLGEDDTNISGGMGGLSGLSGDNDETDIDLGLNLDEETTALDLDEVEKLETAMDDVLSSTDLDEDTDINFSAEQESRDLGAFDEPTSEVVQLKIGDPSDDAEVADLANENDLDFGDLGDLDVDLSTFQKGADSADNLTTDLTDELESTLDEDSYSLDDLELGEDLDIPVAEEEDTGAEDEVSTKIDLARAYIDMGDPDGARDILGEVMDEGSDSQKQQAQALLDSLA